MSILDDVAEARARDLEEEAALLRRWADEKEAEACRIRDARKVLGVHL